MPLYTGIDIGSTCTKTVIMDNNNIVYKSVVPTGWSGVEAAVNVRWAIKEAGFPVDDMRFVATGYGRISVPYANKVVTEISCHAKGAAYIFNDDNCLIIDIGGQDTKIIAVTNGAVSDFLMNDKCSAGTGRFLEVMSNAMGVSLLELCELAKTGSGVKITSMCTVFAESEVISQIGKGTARNDIASGIIDSIVDKVCSQCGKLAGQDGNIYLTGGLCEIDYILNELSKKMEKRIISNPLGRFAGAAGAAIIASTL